jgi:two-component system NtrC family sensor kinase
VARQRADRSRVAVQSVLSAIAGTAAHLCEANDVAILRVEGDQARLVARYGDRPAVRKVGEATALDRGTIGGRAILTRRTVHVRDLAIAVRRDFKPMRDRQRIEGLRTVLATPMLSAGPPSGRSSSAARKCAPSSRSRSPC